jgi:hypothetical protein
MRELYIEGLASHGGPESCVGCSRGRRRSVDRGTRRSGYRAAKSGFWGADAVTRGGRQHRRSRYREWPADPARSENRYMRGVSMFENREVPRSPVPVDDAPPIVVRGVAYRRVAGREGNAEAGSP